MEMRTLGSQGPEISVVGYGAWEAGGGMWGENQSDDMVIAAIHAGLEVGINWIDTAEVYGGGRSEALVGKAIEGRRDDVLVFTKAAPNGAGTGFRPEEVKKAIRGSLDRLGIDHVDLYQLHWPDRSVPIEDTWGAMGEVQDEGLTRFIGVSNFGRSLVERCMDVRPVTSVQNELSLLHPDDKDDLLLSLEEMGVGYLAYSPLGLGMLTGTLTKDSALDDWRGKGDQAPEYFRPGVFEKNLERVERLRPIAKRVGSTVSAIALRWVIEQRGVAGAIVGSRKAVHVRANAAVGDLALDRQTLDEIESIFL